MSSRCVLLAAAVVALACSNENVSAPDNAPVAMLRLVAPHDTLILSDTVRLSATALDAEGRPLAGRQIVWTTGDSGVARVSASGLVSAIDSGTTLIGAQYQGIRDTLRIRVIALHFTALTAAWGHTCGLDADGRAWCWGYNSAGRLGTGDTLNRPLPARVSGGLRFKSLSASDDLTCGVTPAGIGYCWGSNRAGALGDGTSQNRMVPTAVAGGILWDSISGRCGRSRSGAAYCWGDNRYGALGVWGIDSSLTPVAVSGGLQFASLSGDLWKNCGVGADGQGYCWGGNFFGQLGIDSTTQSLVPVPTLGTQDYVSLSADYDRTCGLAGGGAVKCWGTLWYGGGDLMLRRGEPWPEGTGVAFEQVSTGNDLTCGLSAAGQAYCWGFTTPGAFGPPETHAVPVSGGLLFTTIAAGGTNGVNGWACGAGVDTQVYCWSGASVARSEAPVAVVGVPQLDSLSVAESHACGLTPSGDAWCWSLYGGTGVALVGAPLPGGVAFSTLALSDYYQDCGVATDGQAYCWTWNGSSGTPPAPVAGQSGLSFVGISPGYYRHTCAWTVLGAGYCWGSYNRDGRLGTGDTLPSLTPAPVAGGHAFRSIAAGDSHSCGLSTSGDILCWGSEAAAQGGNGVRGDRYTPVPVSGGRQTLAIEATLGGGCLLTLAGDPYCWAYGSLPTLAPGGYKFVQISGTCGLAATGQVSCPTAPALAPAPGGPQFKSITSEGHTCGLSTTGTAYCWGSNYYGELGGAGIRTGGHTDYPVKVAGQP